MKVKEKSRVVGAVGGETPTNGAKEFVEMEIPYAVEVEIQGTADLLFHRWNVEAVQEKADAKKGSKAKKTDDIESYIYRDENGDVAIPTEYLRMSVIAASKFRQDPRSPRKSAADLMKASIVSLTNLVSLGTKHWDYEDKRRVCIQRNAITRCRPAIRAGWKATFRLQCNLPEYVSPTMLNEVIGQAGKLIGIGDFRPSFGRFQVTKFEVMEL